MTIKGRCIRLEIIAVNKIRCTTHGLAMLGRLGDKYNPPGGYAGSNI